MYSLYTALKDNTAKVYTFEPSVFNLEILARNIVLNGLQNQITIIPMALSDKSGTDILHMSTTAWGEQRAPLVRIMGMMVSKWMKYFPINCHHVHWMI